MRGHSSAGRAPALQAGGRRFDPGILHLVGKQDKKELESRAGEARLDPLSRPLEGQAATGASSREKGP